MKLWNKIFPALFLSTTVMLGCAGPFQQINLSPPQEAHVYVTSEIAISEVCFDDERIEDKEAQRKCFPPKENKAVGSGIHIRKYKNPRTKQNASLILTARHLCDVIPETKRELIALYFPTRLWTKEMWAIADEKINLAGSPTIKWRYHVYDYTGIKYNVSPVVVARSHVQHDLCLLESDRIDHDVLKFAVKSPEYGTKVINVSNPLPGQYMNRVGGHPQFYLISEGFVVNNDEKYGVLAISDLSVSFGSSGSMIVVRRGNRWELVGMVFGITTTRWTPYPPLYTLAARIEKVDQFVESEFQLYLKRESKIARKIIEAGVP